VPEVAVHLGREMRARAFRVEMDDGDVVELGGPRDETVEQDRRRRRRAMEIEPITGADDRDGFLG
jgi:hypothetical protein